MDPDDDLAQAAGAQARFDALLAGLTDSAARQPSTLPGWSVGHLLTHVARNADSHVRRVDAAARGEMVDQYEGGPTGRAAQIEAGAGRPAAELVDDVITSGAAALAAFTTVTAEMWDVTSRDGGGTVRTLRELPGRRWQELEVHVLDLRLGATHRDWSSEFVAHWLPLVRASLPSRLPAGAVVPAIDERDELAWLYGRLDRPDLPELAPWA